MRTRVSSRYTNFWQQTINSTNTGTNWISDDNSTYPPCTHFVTPNSNALQSFTAILCNTPLYIDGHALMYNVLYMLSIILLPQVHVCSGQRKKVPQLCAKQTNIFSLLHLSFLIRFIGLHGIFHEQFEGCFTYYGNLAPWCHGLTTKTYMVKHQ